MPQSKRERKAFIESGPLRKFRKALQISIASAAQQAGVSWHTWIMWEHGVAFPSKPKSVDGLKRLCGRDIIDKLKKWNSNHG